MEHLERNSISIQYQKWTMKTFYDIQPSILIKYKYDFKLTFKFV